MNNSSHGSRWATFARNRMGPGIIVACVVIGPGSIMTSSKIGADYGFQLTWVLLLAALLMMTYMNLGTRLGMMAEVPPGELVSRIFGRWLTLLIGMSVFCISSSYQFGNNLGVASALDGLLDEGKKMGGTSKILVVAVCNLFAIAFLFAFKNLYKRLEQLMTFFVGMMLIAFLLNLTFAKPSLSDLLAGFIPTLPSEGSKGSGLIPVIGWIGTTFITVVAYYQAYLVQQKGWKKERIQQGVRDSWVGTVILSFITLMIVATSASVLRGQSLDSPAQVAQQLEPFFGAKGQFIFCAGLFSAAYSSFLINSMMGGFMLSDGLGLGSDPRLIWPRLFTMVVLLIGMGVAVATIISGKNPVAAIVLAQALTVIAAPLTGGVLWWLTSRRDIMGDQANRWHHHLGAALGFFILLGFSSYLVSARILPVLLD